MDPGAAIRVPIHREVGVAGRAPLQAQALVRTLRTDAGTRSRCVGTNKGWHREESLAPYRAGLFIYCAVIGCSERTARTIRRKPWQTQRLRGRGHFDMAAYDDYLAGRLEDYAYPQAEVEAALCGLPQV